MEPYCFTYHNNVCGTMLNRMAEIRYGCIPIFYDWASPGISCSTYYRCRKKFHNLLIIFTEKLSEDKTLLCTCLFFFLAHCDDTNKKSE